MTNNTLAERVREVMENNTRGIEEIYYFLPKEDKTNDNHKCVRADVAVLSIQDTAAAILDVLIDTVKREGKVAISLPMLEHLRDSLSLTKTKDHE